MKEWKPLESLADEAFVEKLLLPKADLVRSEGSTPQVPGHPPKSDHLVPVAVKVSALTTPVWCAPSLMSYPGIGAMSKHEI